MSVRFRLGRELRTKIQSWDVLQEVMLECLRSLESFEPRSPASFLRWLDKIVENRIRNLLDYFHAGKRNIRRETSLDRTAPGAEPRPVVDQLPSPSEAVVLAEEAVLLEEAIDQLNPHERDVIVSRMIEQRSFEDVGADYGISRDAARMRCNRAMAKLTRVFKQLVYDADVERTGPPQT